MKIPWPHGRREREAWGAIAVAGTLAIGARWLEHWRLRSPDRLALSELRVTNAGDAGPGSLREAILAADRSSGRARILVSVPRITLAAALPPLVNPNGVVIEAGGIGTEIDATRIQGPVLDVAAPSSTVSDLRIVGGLAGVVVRAPAAAFHKLSIVDSDTGILIGQGSSGTRIADSVFSRNAIGVYAAATAGTTIVQNGRFEDHRTAAVWASAAVEASAGGGQINVADTNFRNDAMGIVIVNTNARVERNSFDGLRRSAIYVSGGRLVITENRIRGGRGFGIFAEHMAAARIDSNEIARHCEGGLMLRDAGNVQVVANELYQNGYGIVLLEGPAARPNTVADNLIVDHILDGLVMIGSSPIVTRNRLLRNRQAGLRLSAWTIGAGKQVVPAPLLDENILIDNGRDEPQRDAYEQATETSAPAPADCAWRLGTSAIYPVQRAGR